MLNIKLIIGNLKFIQNYNYILKNKARRLFMLNFYK